MPFQLRTHDMERHSVELRMFVDKARRRFQAANQSDVFERILQNQLPSGEELEQQENFIKIDRVGEEETRRLGAFLTKLVDKCNREEQHELLQEALRKSLHQSRRKSIVDLSSGQIKEPLCYYCGGTDNGSCNTAGLSSNPSDRPPAIQLVPYAPEVDPSEPSQQNPPSPSISPASGGTDEIPIPHDHNTRTRNQRPESPPSNDTYHEASHFEPHIELTEDPQLTPPQSVGTPTPDLPLNFSKQPSEGCLDLSGQSLKQKLASGINQLQLPKTKVTPAMGGAVEDATNASRFHSAKSREEHPRDYTPGEALMENPLSPEVEVNSPNEHEDSLNEFFVRDNQRESRGPLEDMRSSTPLGRKRDLDDDEDTCAYEDALMIDTQPIQTDSEEEEKEEKLKKLCKPKTCLVSSSQGSDSRRKSRVTFDDKPQKFGPGAFASVKRPPTSDINVYESPSCSKQSRSVKSSSSQPIDSDTNSEANQVGINPNCFNSSITVQNISNVSKISLRTPAKIPKNQSAKGNGRIVLLASGPTCGLGGGSSPATAPTTLNNVSTIRKFKRTVRKSDIKLRQSQ